MADLFDSKLYFQAHVQGRSSFGLISVPSLVDITAGTLVMIKDDGTTPGGSLKPYDGTGDPVGILETSVMAGEQGIVRHLGEMKIGIHLVPGSKYYADFVTHRLSLDSAVGPCMGFAIDKFNFYVHKDPTIEGGTLDMDTFPVIPSVIDIYGTLPSVTANGDRVLVNNIVYQVDGGAWVAKSHQDGQVVYLVDKKQDYIKINGVWEPLYDLSLYEEKSNKGIADGYAPLDSDSKVPKLNLPELGHKAVVVDTVADRDALLPVDENIEVYVLDASADPTVDSGPAYYLYDKSTSTWHKVSTGGSGGGVVDIPLTSAYLSSYTNNVWATVYTNNTTKIQGVYFSSLTNTGNSETVVVSLRISNGGAEVHRIFHNVPLPKYGGIENAFSLFGIKPNESIQFMANEANVEVLLSVGDLAEGGDCASLTDATNDVLYNNTTGKDKRITLVSIINIGSNASNVELYVADSSDVRLYGLTPPMTLNGNQGVENHTGRFVLKDGEKLKYSAQNNTTQVHVSLKDN